MIMQPTRSNLTSSLLPNTTLFRSHVASLAPATGAEFSVLPAENATGNFTKSVQRVPVRVLLDGDASRLGLLRPGLSVVATVDTKAAATRDRAVKEGAAKEGTAP